MIIPPPPRPPSRAAQARQSGYSPPIRDCVAIQKSAQILPVMPVPDQACPQLDWGSGMTDPASSNIIA
jgi:hypothetical protein